jgi:excisionase family DNA binding protein
MSSPLGPHTPSSTSARPASLARGALGERASRDSHPREGHSGEGHSGKGHSSKSHAGNDDSGDGHSGDGAAPKTAALFVRIPTDHARRLDRAAFALRVHKQTLVSELVDRYVNPDSAASLFALANGWGSGTDGGARSAERRADQGADQGVDSRGAAQAGDRARRRVTVETLDHDELTVGRHSFRPRDTDVLTLAEVAELLQVDPEVVLDLACAGELPGRNLRGEWRFARPALLAWLSAGTAAAETARDTPGVAPETATGAAKG